MSQMHWMEIGVVFTWIGIAAMIGGTVTNWRWTKRNKAQSDQLIAHWNTLRDYSHRFTERSHKLMRDEAIFEMKCHAAGISVEVEEITPDERRPSRLN